MKKNLFIFIMMVGALLMSSGCITNPTVQVSTPVAVTTPGTPVPEGQINIPGVSIQVNAPGPNPLLNKDDSKKGIAGILLGIWHGIISPVTLIISFFNPSIQMYEVHNDGSPYNLGFLVGVAIIFLILGISAGSRRR
jgi:hypothetical protein